MSILAVFGAGVIGITQTAMFRSWLRDLIVRTASSELNGTLTFGELHGNLVTGVRIDNIEIEIDGVPMFQCDGLIARYNPLRLPSNYVSIAEVVIRHPRVWLTKGVHDTSWNFERLLKPSQNPPGPFVWTIDARDFELQDGTVSVMNSSSAATSHDHLNFTNVVLHNVNLSAAVKISRLVQDVTINHFSAREPVTGFYLRELAGAVYRAPDTMRVAFWRLETDRSKCSLYAGMGRVDTTSRDSGLALFAHVPISIAMNADSVSFDDAKLFVPSLSPMARSAMVVLKAQGTLARLSVSECVVKLDRTYLALTGTVEHIDIPATLAGDIQITKSIIVPVEIPTRMPGFVLPDMSAIGTVTISQMSVKGTLHKVESKFALTSGAGSATGTASLDATESIPKIAADVNVNNVDLASIMQTLPASGITGHIVVHGTGSTPVNFAGMVNADLSATHVAGRTIDRMTARTTFSGGSVRIDTLSGTLADSGGSLQTYGVVGFRSGVSYDVHVSTEALNIAAITKDDKRTRLTAQIGLKGHGIALDSITIDPLVMKMYESRLYGRTIPAFNGTLTLTHPDPQTTVTNIVSDLGTVNFTGHYRIDQLLMQFVGLGHDVAVIVQKQITPAFSTSAPPPPDTAQYPPPPFVDASYSLVITNPALLSAFLETKLGGRSTISGTIHADSLGAHQTVNALFGGFTMAADSFAMRLGKTQIDVNFSRAFTLTAVAAQNGPVGNAPPATRNAKTKSKPIASAMTNRISHVREDIAVTCSTDSLRVNSFALGETHAHIGLKGDDGDFSASTVMPSSQHMIAAISGGTHFTPGTCTVRLDTLEFQRGDQMHVRGQEPGEIAFSRGAIAVHHLSLASDSADVRITGDLDSGRFKGMQFSVHHMNLAGLKKYADADVFRGLDGMVDSLTATIDGTMDDPTIQIPVLKGSNLVFRGNAFGNLEARFRAANKNVEGEIHFGSAAQGGKDSVEHRMDIDVHAFPFDCALGSVAKRVPDGGALDVRTRATSFPITFLELLFGTTVDHLRGFATGKLALSGKTPDVRYNGSFAVEDVQFRAVSTKIPYAARADIVMYNDTLEISSSQITNNKEDSRDSWARVWGYLYFHGLSFSSFDLYCDADQMMVLSRASRRPNSSVYGPMIISSQQHVREFESIVPSTADALHFFGTMDQPHLEGTIYVQENNLVFPQTSDVDNGGTFAVVYDMTSAQKIDQGSDSGSSSSSSGPLAQTVAIEAGGGGLLDRMRYNLRIKTQKDLHITMDFGDYEHLNDVLLAGELTYLKEEDGRAHLTGTLGIKGGTYSFYDAFTIDSKSSMTFIDSVENPQMHITAATIPRLYNGTKFVQVTIEITGTRKAPIMVLHLLTGDQSNRLVEDATNPDKERADAIMFLATGQMFDENAAGGSPMSSGLNVLGSSLSQILGKFLGAKGVGFGVQIDATDFAKSRVTVSQSWGKFLLGAGAKGIKTETGPPISLDASVSFSLGDILSIVWLEQTHISAERRQTESATGAPTPEPVYAVRIGASDVLSAIGGGFNAAVKWVSGTGPKSDTSNPKVQIKSAPDNAPAPGAKKMDSSTDPIIDNTKKLK